MSNNQNNSNQGNQNDKPRICSRCFEFYGTKERSFLCSQCYKESIAESNPEKEESPILTSLEETLNTILSKEQILKSEGSPKSEVLTSEIAPKKQIVDSSKCKLCPKKLGCLPYICKCENAYCTIHRLPEDHECTFDWKTHQRNILTKLNPRVVAEKLTRI